MNPRLFTVVNTNECLTSEGLFCLNKKCNCPDPDNYYFSAANSSCLPRKAISQACTTNVECFSRELLTCINSVCQCPNTTTYYYSEFNNTCQEKNTYINIQRCKTCRFIFIYSHEP